MSTWLERKEDRRREHVRYHGVKCETCVACNGSGVYDHNGTPPCASCEGTGRVRRPRRNEEVDAILAAATEQKV
jgi:DnaJ-class molecular chaperone|nr:hypothetical protein [Neorhizobium tomejilense]